MSQFGGSLVQSPLAGASVEEAFYVVLMCAVAVDGEVQSAEQEEFMALTRRSSTLSPVRDMHAEWWSKYKEIMSGDGQFDSERVKLLAEQAAILIPSDMRVAVFAHACDIVFADVSFEMEEQWLIRRLAVLFELPFDQVRQIVEVLSWKNQF